MTFPTAPPSAETARPEPPHRSDRFYAWVAGLGIARSDGWIGGVAAGIASRLRIDPLIVRGVLVVAALCGLPMILVYALAWALLPDPEGRIHLRELFRGRFQPAQLGILAGLIVGLSTMSPPATLFLVARILNPYAYPSYGISAFGVFLFVIGLVLVGILLVLIVRAARRTPGGEVTDPRMASAVAPPPFPSAPAGYSGAAVDAETREEDAAAEGAIPASSLPSAPPTADAAALEAWRAQHAAWQEQDQAWRRQQQDAERAARDQARRERQTMAAEFAAEAAERRRIRRASNPRASFAYVATAIGLAVVAGAVVWLLSQNPDVVTAGLALFSAALVLALGMVVAGVARRRSGFLAFVTVIALVAALITGGAATLGDVRFGSTSVWNSEGSNSIRQPFGTTMIQLQNLPSLASPPVTVHKGSGYTEIYVGDGVKLQLTATVRDVRVQWQRIDLSADGDTIGTEDGSYSGSRQADGSTVYRETVTTPLDPNRPADDPDVPQTVVSVPVTIDQDSGQIRVLYLTRPDQEKPE